MRLRNYTDISNETIRAIVRSFCPSGISGFDVRVSNMGRPLGSCWWPIRGRAYSHGSSYHDRACSFIVVSLGSRNGFPCAPKQPARKSRGYLPLPWFASREEAAVYVIANELRHLWQTKVKRGHRVWGARGQYSERDADTYAIRALRQWRKVQVL